MKNSTFVFHNVILVCDLHQNVKESIKGLKRETKMLGDKKLKQVGFVKWVSSRGRNDRSIPI